MEHPKDKGERTTQAVIAALQVTGHAVLVPIGENTRYDLVIDNGVDLLRVQCKTGRLRNGVVLFATCSCYGHHRNPTTARRDYHGQVDYFAVHCGETTGVYLISVGHLPNRVQGALRVNPPRNNQRRGVRLAAGYEIAKVKVTPTARPVATAGASAPSA